MLAIKDKQQNLDVGEMKRLLCEELGLNNTFQHEGKQCGTSLAFRVSPCGDGKHSVAVVMSHTPKEGVAGEYCVTFKDPFEADSPQAAEELAVKRLYQIVTEHAEHRLRTDSELTSLAGLAFGEASHVFDGINLGEPRGNSLNPNPHAHQFLNDETFCRETLKNVAFQGLNGSNPSLVALNIGGPAHWVAVEAPKGDFTGSKLHGEVVFERCSFPHSRWAGVESIPTHDGKGTTFRGCDLDGATFSHRGKQGAEGPLTFDSDCSLKNASLMYLAKGAAVRLGVLDELLIAMESKTAGPDFKLPMNTIEARQQHSRYLKSLETKARENLKGLMWDSSTLPADDPERAKFYKIVLLRISKVANPLDVIDRIRRSDVDPWQVLDLLQNSPGIDTGTPYVDARTTENVIAISGVDANGRAPWQAEVRVSKTGEVRVTGPAGVPFSHDRIGPSRLRDELGKAVPEDKGAAECFACARACLGNLLGESNVSEARGADGAQRALDLKLSHDVTVKLLVDPSQSDPKRRFVFACPKGTPFLSDDEQVLDDHFNPYAVAPRETLAATSALDLIRRLGAAKGGRKVDLDGWTHHQV